MCRVPEGILGIALGCQTRAPPPRTLFSRALNIQAHGHPKVV